MSTKSLAESFSNELTRELRELPEDFFRTFRFTTRGNNYTHPLTLGAISKVVTSVPGVAYVGVDVRLNNCDGTKFQPDIVGFDRELNPKIIIDYESPNSSDARIPLKDWGPYAKWAPTLKNAPPYIVITTLPDSESPDWELRWTTGNQYNVAFRGKREEIRKNPFRFWYQHYGSEREKFSLDNIHMININSGVAHVALF